MATPCITCAQNPEVKAKPGIFPCLGCQQMFCTQHVAFHRQELASQLDFVISDRNELQETIARQKDMINVSLQLNVIDEWEKKSIDQIHQAADNLRQQILSLAEEQKRSFKDQFNQLSQQLDSFREDENFYEQDIELLKEKCASLKCLLNLVDIDIMAADISSFLEQTVTVIKKEEKVVEEKISEEKPIEKLSFTEDLVLNRKPYNRIRIPHDGRVCVLKDLVLIYSGNDFTLMDLKSNSLQSGRLGSKSSLICSSTYINGFLCATPNSKSYIQVLRLAGKNLNKVNGFDTITFDISCMACFDDRMMVVCHGTHDMNCLQEWSLKGIGTSQQADSSLHIWQPPLTCKSSETINNLTFDNEQIALIITGREKSPKNRIELRTRNMNSITYLLMSDCKIYSSYILCRVNDGYLLSDAQDYKNPRRFTLIDNQMVARKQKFLSTYGVKNIETIKFESNISTLLIYREDRSDHTFGNDSPRLFLDFYQI